MREPMGHVLAQLDDAVPLTEHLGWLMMPREELGGRRAMDYIDADALEPVALLLVEMAVAEEPNGSRRGSA